MALAGSIVQSGAWRGFAVGGGVTTRGESVLVMACAAHVIHLRAHGRGGLLGHDRAWRWSRR